jgi:ATP-dependent Clp protease ATP-binding subunit ClpB
VTDDARDWLARTGYDADLGARPLRRVLQHAVENPLALALLEGRYADGDTVTVDASDGGVSLG